MSGVAEPTRPRDVIAAALDAAIHDGGPFDTAEGQAAIAVEALFAAGYKIVHPALSQDDCMDPWVCCIHERPKDGFR